jgi:hypothetical protein
VAIVIILPAKNYVSIDAGDSNGPIARRVDASALAGIDRVVWDDVVQAGAVMPTLYQPIDLDMTCVPISKLPAGASDIIAA